MKPFYYLSLAVSLLALETVWAAGCDAKERKPQTAAPSSDTVAKVENGTVVIVEKEKLSQLNKEIPPVCPNAVRFVSHDANGSKDSSNLDFMEAINPTVLFIQRPGDDQVSIIKDLQKLKLSHKLVNDNIMLASKFPFGKTETMGVHDAVMTSITVEDKKIAIIGISDRSQSHSVESAEKLLKYIKDVVTKDYDSYVLMGGFNEAWDSKVVEVFSKSGIMEESFRSLTWTPPSYTYIGETRSAKDFIFVSNALKKDLLGSYVFYPSHPGHLPIMVDVKAPGAGKASTGVVDSTVPFYSLERYGWYIILGSAAVVVLAAGLVFFMMRGRSSHF